MKIIQHPSKDSWLNLTSRPVTEIMELFPTVQEVFSQIKSYGDKALFEYTEKFDKVKLTNLKVSKEELDDAETLVSHKLKESIQVAYTNIYKFHKSQKETPKKIETSKGVSCWRESRPIEKVGFYIPGGTAPLFSTVLMLGIPAEIAGVKERLLCSPPDDNGKIHPTILYTAKLVGVTSVYKIGGIQAVGAMAFGTQTIPQVDKIFGPGNQYVTVAKQFIQNFGIAIDMPAGPSEVLIIADKQANASFVAADLLSQAEHGVDSQVICLSDRVEVLEKVIQEIKVQTKTLPRKEIILKALENSKFIVFKTIDKCIEFSNLYAPEHLILNSENAVEKVSLIQNAGSVFLGNYSCESAGDYASGTNHTLPTNGFSKVYSGVSLDSFLKKITVQKLTGEGIQSIGKAIECMAEAEGLEAHKNAVTIRLKSL